MKSIVLAVLLIFSTSAFAQVVSVNVYQPIPGGAQQLSAYFQEAKSILQAAGAQVTTTSDLKGIFRFGVAFDNWEAFGRFSQSLQGNESWGAFQNKIAGTRVSNQIDNLLLDQRVAPATPGGGPGAVSQITVWEPTTGTMAQVVEGAMGAKPIHERAGATVSVYTGGGRMYYLQTYPSFEAWGKNRDTPNPEFQAYMQSLGTAGGPGCGGSGYIHHYRFLEAGSLVCGVHRSNLTPVSAHIAPQKWRRSCKTPTVVGDYYRDCAIFHP